MKSQVAIVSSSLAPFGPLFVLQQTSKSLPIDGVDLHVITLADNYQRTRLSGHPNITIHQLENARYSQSITNRLNECLDEIDPELVQWWGISPRNAVSTFGSWRQRWQANAKFKSVAAGPIGSTSAVVACQTRSTTIRGKSSYREIPWQLDWQLEPHNLFAEQPQSQLLDRAPSFAEASYLTPAVSQQSQDRKLVRAAVSKYLQIPDESYWIVTVADLVPKNQLKDLIWGLDLLRCIRNDVHLLVIGRGPQQTRLQRFAELTESAEAVHWLQMPEQADRIVAASDIYWQAHLNDSVPQGMMVAMAAKIPVVSALGPTTAPLILPQQTAWAVPCGARDQYARWTKYVLENPEATQLMVEQAYRNLQPNRRVEQFVSQLDALFSSRYRSRN